MSHPILGILMLSLVLPGYFFSWRYNQKGDYKLALALLMLCGLIMRLYLSSDLFLHEWDERYHALVAKNMMNHFLVPTLYNDPVLPYQYENWTGNHIWLHKQPLPIWSMAASMKLFGINEIALRLPSILLSTAGILLTFSIADFFSGRRSAYIAAFLFSLNGLIIEVTGGRVATDHVDLFFLFFVELAVFFSVQFVRKKNNIYNLLVGLSLGAAILCKWLPALIVLPVWLLIVLDSGTFRRKTILFQLLLICCVTALVFLPWQLHIFHQYPLEASWESTHNIRHFFEELDEQGGPLYYYLVKIRIIYGELIYLPLIWFFWKTYKEKSLKRIAIAVWILIPLLFFSLAATKMQGYLLFTSAAYFIVTAEFWSELQNRTIASRPLKFLRSLVLFLLIALPVRYCIERLKPFQDAEREPRWAVSLKELSHHVNDSTVLFNYKRPIEAMFYTDLVAYEILPDKLSIEKIMRKGYQVMINDDGNVPEEIKSTEGVIFIKIPEDQQ